MPHRLKKTNRITKENLQSDVLNHETVSWQPIQTCTGIDYEKTGVNQKIIDEAECLTFHLENQFYS